MTDQTGTLTPGQVQLLESRLKAFEDSTSNQIVVVMIPSIGNGSIEDLSMRIAEANKVGIKKRDNGVLLLIAKNDRRMRIEVGYGLEGPLPDALSGQIIRHEIGPAFRQGDYFGGISAGVDAIMLATKGEYKAIPRSSGDKPANLLPFFILIIIVFVVASAIVGILGGLQAYGFLGMFLGPAVIAILSIPVGHWSDRQGRRVFSVAACGIVVLYSAVFAVLSPGAGIWPLLAGLLLMGTSFGIAAGPAASRIIESAPRGEEGTGSSLMVTTIYFGGVLGTAIYAALFTFVTAGAGGIVAFTDLDPATFLAGFHITIAAGIAFAVLAVVLSAVVPDWERSE